MNDPDLLSHSEAAAILSVPEKRLHDFVGEGRIEAIQDTRGRGKPKAFYKMADVETLRRALVSQMAGTQSGLSVVAPPTQNEEAPSPEQRAYEALRVIEWRTKALRALPVLTLQQFCDMVSITRTAAHKEHRAGNLKWREVGGVPRISQESVDEWLKTLTTKTPD